VTEKGYCLTPAGDLDEDHPDIRADLASPAAPASFPGWVVAGLRARRAAGLPPLTVIACDNLTDNGVKLKAAVVQLARATDRGLADWIDAEAAFPRTMVDSITPATDDALRGRVERELGLHDAWPIQREAFTQWVIERDDRARGPDWTAAGAELTGDVRGYETCKLRLLNGAHSSLAYLGLLRGHGLVRDAMADPELAAFARALMVEAVRPTLKPPGGFDVDAYIEAVLARFRNPAIDHQLSQIAWDGSQKLPFRLMGTVADLVAMGAPVDLPALGLAAWMRFVVRQAKAGVALTDPLADRLAELGGGCTGDAAADVARLAPLIVPPELLADHSLRQALERAYAKLGPA
jgi:fructuronate reductase